MVRFLDFRIYILADRKDKKCYFKIIPVINIAMPTDIFSDLGVCATVNIAAGLYFLSFSCCFSRGVDYLLIP